MKSVSVSARIVRILAVVAIATTVTFCIGATRAGAATSEATFQTVNCMIAQTAFDYAADQLLEAPRGSDVEKYWQRQVGYWSGYMVGAGC